MLIFGRRVLKYRIGFGDRICLISTSFPQGNWNTEVCSNGDQKVKRRSDVRGCHAAISHYYKILGTIHWIIILPFQWFQQHRSQTLYYVSKELPCLPLWPNLTPPTSTTPILIHFSSLLPFSAQHRQRLLPALEAQELLQWHPVYFWHHTYHE